jgi:uncharacterized membrane protein
MGLLDILALFIMGLGFAVVFAAKLIVEKFNMQQKQKCDFESELSQEEIDKYKLNKAIVNIKMMGLIITIPGLILFIISYKR